MNKYIKHALKDWADVKGFEIHFYADAGRDSSYYVDKNGASHPHPTLDLSWWNEVSILEIFFYTRELALIIGLSHADRDHWTPSELMTFSNATIAQRCEAKYRAEVGA